MTDEELERALFALPLETPPADLHALILSATVYRPRLSVPMWEVWTLGTIAACMAWLTIVLFNTPAQTIAHLSTQFTALVASVWTPGTFAPNGVLLWMSIGISAAIWISQLTFVPKPQRVTHR
jgi:hypothetical protein